MENNIKRCPLCGESGIYDNGYNTREICHQCENDLFKEVKIEPKKYNKIADIIIAFSSCIFTLLISLVGLSRLEIDYSFYITTIAIIISVISLGISEIIHNSKCKKQKNNN